MISQQNDPVAWALLQYELEDAHEGLETLFKEIKENPAYGEEEFTVDMAHIYMHLNRAWNSRNAHAEQHDDEALWDKWANFSD